MKYLNYNDKYRDDVHYICKYTGPPESFTDKKIEKYILNSYCDYYIDCEPENCFVITDETDKAVGYILCAENYREYSAKSRDYFKTAFKNAGISKIELIAERLALKAFSGKYPAHLHIDIVDEYTRKGYGSVLIKMLITHLKSKKVKALMLIVGSGNKPAVRFYKRIGFKVLISGFGGTVMGMKLK